MKVLRFESGIACKEFRRSTGFEAVLHVTIPKPKRCIFISDRFGFFDAKIQKPHFEIVRGRPSVPIMRDLQGWSRVSVRHLSLKDDIFLNIAIQQQIGFLIGRQYNFITGFCTFHCFIYRFDRSPPPFLPNLCSSTHSRWIYEPNIFHLEMRGNISINITDPNDICFGNQSAKILVDQFYGTPSMFTQIAQYVKQCIVRYVVHQIVY